MRSLDGSSDVLQEGFDILLGRLDEQFPVGISAHVLSEEIEAVLHMRDLGFLVGELQTAFLQEVSHERLNLVTKKFLRDARDQEVIRIADQVDFVAP